MGASLIVNCLGALIVRENFIEKISLLSRSMKNFQLLALVFSLHFVPVHHDLKRRVFRLEFREMKQYLPVIDLQP